MSALFTSISIDHLKTETEGDPLHRSGAVISAHLHFAEISVWGYDPAAFRRLAAALTAAAMTLEAAQQEASAPAAAEEARC